MDNDSLNDGLHLPTLDDMRRMLRLASELHELPGHRRDVSWRDAKWRDASWRAPHLVEQVRQLIDAAAGQAWVLDAGGRATGGIASPARPAGVGRSGAGRSAPGRAAPTPEDDPAAALMARSARKRTPVVRTRDELIDPETWRRAASCDGWDDAIYSLHHDASIEPAPSRSLLAFYRRKGAGPWTARERGIVRLVHAQCAWVFAGVTPGQPSTST